jgi:hypothetical protein
VLSLENSLTGGLQSLLTLRHCAMTGVIAFQKLDALVVNQFSSVVAHIAHG